MDVAGFKITPQKERAMAKTEAKSGKKSARPPGADAEGPPQMQTEPKSPMPKQHHAKPGIESEVTPRPRYQAPKYKAAGKLLGKAALITGGDSGIGRAVAVLYAREGADVAISYLPEEQSDAEETLQAVEAEGRRCVLIPGDLKQPKFSKELVERTVKDLGSLDILVSNAAHQNRKKTLDELT